MPTRDLTLRLRAGVRVSRRGEGRLQVGLHAEDRVMVEDSPDLRALLGDLRHGVRVDRVPAPLRATVDTLRARGLAVPVTEAADRSRVRGSARIGVVAADPDRSHVLRLLSDAGLEPAGRGDSATAVLHVTRGAEPRRTDLDGWMREDRVHLPLVSLGGHTRLGPFVVPGVTACLRCVDEHLTDRDPRHPLVLEQHHDADLHDEVRPEDLQLALAWAVRDLARWLEGGLPVTWSATMELGSQAPTVLEWRRHPRCGCAWGHALTG